MLQTFYTAAGYAEAYSTIEEARHPIKLAAMLTAQLDSYGPWH